MSSIFLFSIRLLYIYWDHKVCMISSSHFDKILLCMYLCMVFSLLLGRERFKKSSLYALSRYIVRCSIILVLDIGWFSLFLISRFIGHNNTKILRKRQKYLGSSNPNPHDGILSIFNVNLLKIITFQRNRI